jgi:hypothetical protein
MIRLLLVLGVLAVGLTGCLNPHMFGAKGVDTGKESIGQRPPPVYPHQINDTNANAMAKALDAEMDFDTHRDDVKSPGK